MCKVIEDMLKEMQMEIAKKLLLEESLTLEKIAEYVDLPLEEVQKLQVERRI